MSAWWFDADGRRSLPEPILDFLEAVSGYGDIVRAGRRVARAWDSVHSIATIPAIG